MANTIRKSQYKNKSLNEKVSRYREKAKEKSDKVKAKNQ